MVASSVSVDVGRGATLNLATSTFHGSARGTADTTGTTLWPTVLPLLLHLQGVYPRVQDSLGVSRPLRVLELGAGCGLLGLGLAATCGANVCLTESAFALDDDGEHTSLSWLQSNVEANREIVESTNLGGVVSTAKLCWGECDDHDALREQQPDLFDLVIASDVMYDAGKYPMLLDTLTTFAGSSEEALKPRGADIDDAAAILGYQMRIGAERRFGDEAEDFDVVRTELPDPSQKSRWTAKNVAYFVRS